MVIWAGLTHLTGAPSSSSRCPLSQLEAGQRLGTAPGSLSPCLFWSSIRLAQAPSWRGSELRSKLSMPSLLAYAQGTSPTFSWWKQVTKSVWGRRHGEFGGVFKFAVVFSPFHYCPYFTKVSSLLRYTLKCFPLVSLQDTLCFLTYTSVTSAQHFVSQEELSSNRWLYLILIITHKARIFASISY